MEYYARNVQFPQTHEFIEPTKFKTTEPAHSFLKQPPTSQTYKNPIPSALLSVLKERNIGHTYVGIKKDYRTGNFSDLQKLIFSHKRKKVKEKGKGHYKCSER